MSDAPCRYCERATPKSECLGMPLWFPNCLQELAALKERCLVRNLASMQNDACRRDFFEGMGKHHAADVVQALRRKVYAHMQPPAPAPVDDLFGMDVAA